MTDIDWAVAPPKGYWRDPKGNLVHESNIRPAELDMDEVTRLIHLHGEALAAQMYRYRDHTLADVYAYVDRLVGEYGGKLKGSRGNVQLRTFDGRWRVLLAQADEIAVGPEIEAAQALISECVSEWAGTGNKKLRALVEQAFSPARDGRLSVSRLLALRRIVIDDPRWQRAQDAISDALRPIGRAEYIRLYRRDTPRDPWEPVPLSLAAARRPPAEAEDADVAGALRLRVGAAARDARARGMTQKDIRAAVLESIRIRPRKEAGEGAE